MCKYRVIQTVTFSVLDCPSFNNIKIFNLKINHYKKYDFQVNFGLLLLSEFLCL